MYNSYSSLRCEYLISKISDNDKALCSHSDFTHLHHTHPHIHAHTIYPHTHTPAEEFALYSVSSCGKVPEKGQGIMKAVFKRIILASLCRLA